MRLDEFMTHAKGYALLGGAVQEQLDSIMQGEGLEEQNPNALKYIGEFLRQLQDDLDDDEAGALATRIESSRAIA